MKSQAILTITLLFATISVQGSSNPITGSIEEEFPGAPCPSLESSPLRSSTQVHRNQAASTFTNPHVVSPLDFHNLSICLTENPQSITTKMTPHRYYVTARKSDLSKNWREDSLVDANDNAQSIELVQSKNEAAFQKTYLAAALRAMNKQQPAIHNHTCDAKSKTQTYAPQADTNIEEQDEYTDQRENNPSMSRRISLSLCDEKFWKLYPDPAFWNNSFNNN